MKTLKDKIIKILDDKKAVDIKTIQIDELSILADFFVIATGTSSTHIKALSGELEKELKNGGIMPKGIEGRATGWILLDYGSVIVHLFLPDQRDYYNLERLWSDAKIVDFQGENIEQL
ncbi:MAG: ribosome silencing factor [Oscillospiraceae bacterium]|nr:ribosome silencing factor [Oscillospiraceae bacterium]